MLVIDKNQQFCKGGACVSVASPMERGLLFMTRDAPISHTT